MIISIASGKGGTGKTTVSTNLSFSLKKEKPVQLLDCDVEEPNCHLFLNPDITEKKKVFTPIPVVDTDKCTLCKKCAEICRFGAITVIGEKVLIFPELCHGCGGCIKVCPDDALKKTGKELGQIEIGDAGGIDFVHGRLKIGQVMSPPLIKQVRSYQNPDKINIIDAPPGTSCPVIAAMDDTDFVLLVTEPTPFGLHDLILAVETVKILKIPAGIVINRCGIGNNDVRDYADKEKIPVLMEIPFDRDIARVYSQGSLIAETMPKMQEKFLQLYHGIEKIIF